MKESVKRRALREAMYVVTNKSTVRQTAEVFEVSKSTVHKDITERLKQVNYRLAEEVRKVLDKNKRERHIRGGLATKKKYCELRRNVDD